MDCAPSCLSEAYSQLIPLWDCLGAVVQSHLVYVYLKLGRPVSKLDTCDTHWPNLVAIVTVNLWPMSLTPMNEESV